MYLKDCEGCYESTFVGTGLGHRVASYHVTIYVTEVSLKTNKRSRRLGIPLTLVLMPSFSLDSEPHHSTCSRTFP
ncbi:hypothetical protein K443DRAFT_486011 [Laccaria amethystina LaAM-08-1]|uniref:Uncharacterized protein n=1 Tax=Laccaria amethystina LaAM-08-1 TaxID=1095629 RepID=A0A0C9X1H2_9AGAR|nr:hypothetical protein K443DRAFT_486011 [Laccaria amethystina LaAM-08-1]